MASIVAWRLAYLRMTAESLAYKTPGSNLFQKAYGASTSMCSPEEPMYPNSITESLPVPIRCDRKACSQCIRALPVAVMVCAAKLSIRDDSMESSCVYGNEVTTAVYLSRHS